MESLRLFTCVDLPTEIKKVITSLQVRLRPLAKGYVSWARPEGLHLTLKFLGQVAASRVAEITGLMVSAAHEAQPFELFISGTGAFPNFSRPRIYWAGIQEPTGTLQRLQSHIEQTFRAAGFAAEERPFSPHLTLGRVKQPQGVADLSRALEETGLAAMSFTATEILLMASDLLPTGPVYTSLKKVALG
jgi:RNA 2',3'-cyclic 3'-phosphodiesterase